MKRAIFMGDTLERIRKFPQKAQSEAGYEIYRVQVGLEPKDWKPLKTVGPGVREIRIRDDNGAFRVIYVANFADTVYVLHAFKKKTQATAKRELDLASRRLAQLTRN